MAVRAHPLGGRPAYDPYRHRRDLYARAAPLFRSFGYRQVTMKALAHACGVTASALYRYFPSKLDFALFPLDPTPTGYCAAMLHQAAAQHADPVRGLRAAIESGLADIELLVLSTRLAIEAGQDAPDVFAAHSFDGAMTAIGEIALRCAPDLDGRAQDLSHSLMSLVISAAASKEDLPAGQLWRISRVLVRAYLVDAGIPAARLDEVFASN